MDITPIYELQTRLKAAAIAGVTLLQEDFRLQRAATAIKPLEGASPVFAKLNQQMALLLSAECENPATTLLDTISLIDAVICTLGTVDIKSPTQTCKAVYVSDHLIANVPYSQAKGIINALTTSGSGNYSYVYEVHETNPAILEDYRVKYALVQALGASYAELAELVSEWLSKENETILPLLKNGFDPKGKREMVRRVQVIEKIAGSRENEFYIKMLDSAEKDVRLALIYALRHDPSNIDLLLKMAKTEKGKNRQMILNILGLYEDERVYELFRSMGAKKPLEVCTSLLPVTTDYASQVIAELCMEWIPAIVELLQNPKNTNEEKIKLNTFCKIVETLIGKHGDAVCTCYKMLLQNHTISDHFENLTLNLDVIDSIGWNRNKINRKLDWELIIGAYMAQSLLLYPDEQLGQMALDLYENNESHSKNLNFLSAAAVNKLVQSSDCSEWFEQQVRNPKTQKVDKIALREIARALQLIQWDKNTEQYLINARYTSMDWEDVRKNISSFIEIPDVKRIKEWLMAHGSQTIDTILQGWVITTDDEECKKYGEYFYNRAFTTTANQSYLTAMRNCNWKICKGLGVFYVKNRDNLRGFYWDVERYLYCLPGDQAAIYAELDAVAETIKSENIKLKGLETTEKVENWIVQMKQSDRFDDLRTIN